MDRNIALENLRTIPEDLQKRIDYGIETYRKGRANILVTDSLGNPVKDAQIRFNQVGHEFKFGANLFMLDELETEEKNQKYKELFKDVFNIATLPFYWDSLEPEKGKPRYDKNSPGVYRRPSPDLCVEFCEENGIEPREHALAYDGFYPKWLYDADVQTCKMELSRRMKEIGERYGSKIPTMEVTNESWWNEGKTAIYEEDDYVEWCFKEARRHMGANKLAINETSRVWKAKGNNRDEYYMQIERALMKGAPIDAIAMQYHIFCQREDEPEYTKRAYNPEHLYKIMDSYAKFGKPLQVSEVTIPAYSWEKEDEEFQAEIVKRLYTIWFSHPAVEQIIYWNLPDGYAHVWNVEDIEKSMGDMTRGENVYYGGLMRFDMTPKPAYNTIKDLVKREWHTEGTGATDAGGNVSFRGFYGEYELEITSNGKTVTKKINLSKDCKNKFTVEI